MIPATFLSTRVKPAATLLSLRGRDKGSREGGDTPKTVGGTAGLRSDASSSSYNLPPHRQLRCPGPLDAEHLYAPKSQSSSHQAATAPAPTPATAQLNLLSCVSILIKGVSPLLSHNSAQLLAEQTQGLWEAARPLI